MGVFYRLLFLTRQKKGRSPLYGSPERDVQEEKYFTVKLQDAIVVESREWYPETFLEQNRSYKHMEDIFFTYETIIWTYVTDGIEAQDSWKKPVMS